MSAPAARPRPPGERTGSALAARLVSWPLVLGIAVLGVAWRLVAWPLVALAPHGGPSGGARLATYARGAAAYLGGRTDRLPSFDGRPRRTEESPGPWWEAKRRLKKSRVALWTWVGVAIYVYVALLAQVGVLAKDYAASDGHAAYVAPGVMGHVLGTDAVGRDVLALALRGTTTALWIGLVAAALSCAIGAVLGAIAGYFGGVVDEVIVWLYTTLESIPQLLLLLAMAFVFKSNPGLQAWYEGSFLKQRLDVSLGLFVMVFAVGTTSWVGVCRTIRGEFLRLRERDYVVAARALGVPTRRILFRHIFPNTLHLVLVSFSLLVIGAIKFEVILSFLGLGVEVGDASWGAMIAGSKLELLRTPTVWWQLTTATAFMFGLVLCVNLLADALRDALDPRLRV